MGRIDLTHGERRGFMHETKKLLKPTNNSVWKTKEPVKCDVCNKFFGRIININTEDKTTSIDTCFKCFDKAFESVLFETEESYVLMRQIIDVDYDTRKSTKKSERGKLTNSLRYLCLKKSNFKCSACGKLASDEQLEIDHIQPISRGGKTILSNLQALCITCNRGKGML